MPCCPNCYAWPFPSRAVRFCRPTSCGDSAVTHARTSCTSLSRELGYVVRTMFLLRYVSEVELRQAIQSATNKSERFNEFVQRISFGGDKVIAENVRMNSASSLSTSLGCKYFGLPQHRFDDKGNRSTEGGGSGNIRRGPGGRRSLSNVAHQPLWAIPISGPAGSRSTTVAPQAAKRRNQQGGSARYGRCRLIQ
jgi:hypothetical protein